jgi:hypothetical protein
MDHAKQLTRREFLDRTKGAGLAATAGLPLLHSLQAAAAETTQHEGGKQFRAGAFAVDITPEEFPVVVNGGFQPRYAKEAHDRLHARCLVLDDGQGQLAIVVVDSCVIDRPLMDRIKRQVQQAADIPAERIFMSATHTHSAPAVAGALNTPPDESYVEFLPGRIVEGVRRAQKNLAPARIGWGVGELPELAQCRRWIARPDNIGTDPFGQETVRATMHPGYRNPDWEEPSGPMDPAVSVLAVQSPQGEPIALLAAYSIHYVGAPALSSDYFGAFADRMAELLGKGDPKRPFVGILANGTSGDAYIRDYTRATPRKFDRFQVADAVAEVAHGVYESIDFHDWVPLVSREQTLELAVREPRVQWAQRELEGVSREEIKTRSQVYAREQLLLDEMPRTREMKLQAVRIGGLGLVGIPCEVFAITGLKIRRRSPLEPTFTISLANGWDGYLPPPEQHALGGYTTWLARSSCLEEQAEPKVVDAVMQLLDDVAGEAAVRRKPEPPGAYAAAVLGSKPTVYWRLDEMNGPVAVDAVSGKPRGTFETQVAYYMEGPQHGAFPGFGPDNRAPHFIGQRLTAHLEPLGPAYSVELWFYNTMPCDVRPVTGYLFSRGTEADGDRLAIGGTEHDPGKLVFVSGDGGKHAAVGRTEIPLRNWVPRESWHHVVLVRQADHVAVYLDGQTQPEISAAAAPTTKSGEVCVAGHAGNRFNFEGRIDEVAIYSRALSPDEIAAHYQAAVKAS